jgi:hypothetical protein
MSGNLRIFAANEARILAGGVDKMKENALFS